MLLQHISEVMSAVLTATIRVMNQPLVRTPGSDCLNKRLLYQILCHTLCHGISDDITAEQVLVTSKV